MPRKKVLKKPVAAEPSKIKRKKRVRHKPYFVYIVECATGTYYTGYTQDLENRLKLHNSGRGAKYLRGKLPVRIIFTKQFAYYKHALIGEKMIKRMSRPQKERLVRNYSGISSD